jgi:hypothetical protein
MPADATFTAEIVEHTPYSRYASCLERTILVITDHDEPDTRSVTNAIEEVLLLCRERFGVDLPSLAIYRDSTGVWDGVRHIEGTFRGFYPIRETDLARAIDKALGRVPDSIRPNAALPPREPR